MKLYIVPTLEGANRAQIHGVREATSADVAAWLHLSPFLDAAVIAARSTP